MGKKVKIMIVDDDSTILKLMENVLDKEKFDIKSLISAKNIKAEILSFTPEIILLDIKMPEITGADAIKIIKSDPDINNMPVIAFTSYSMKGDKEKFIKMGYNGYIAKPINTRTIEDEIMQFI